jgi:ABC-type polar amino acid transport system ATPase subunit
MRALDVTGLSVHRGGKTVVRGVSFGADRQEVLVLKGASGSGKTTILRAIAGLDPIAEGRIAIDDMSLEPRQILRGQARRDFHCRVGMVFQFHHLFEHLTALENVTLAPVHVLGQSRADAQRRAVDLLEQMGIGARAGAMPRELSGGEAQRVAIARALAMEPQVLLMDEPTASLDPARRGDLAAILRQLAAGGRTLVIASHDEDFARACAQRVVTLESGQIVQA